MTSTLVNIVFSRADWTTPSLSQYLWRTLTSPIIAHTPLLPEDEIFTEGALTIGIQKLEEYLFPALLGASILLNTVGLTGALLFGAAIVIAPHCFSGLVVLTFGFWWCISPYVYGAIAHFYSKYMDAVLTQAKSRLSQMQAFSKLHESKAHAGASWQRRRLLLCA